MRVRFKSAVESNTWTICARVEFFLLLWTVCMEWLMDLEALERILLLAEEEQLSVRVGRICLTVSPRWSSVGGNVLWCFCWFVCCLVSVLGWQVGCLFAVCFALFYVEDPCPGRDLGSVAENMAILGAHFRDLCWQVFLHVELEGMQTQGASAGNAACASSGKELATSSRQVDQGQAS